MELRIVNANAKLICAVTLIATLSLPGCGAPIVVNPRNSDTDVVEQTSRNALPDNERGDPSEADIATNPETDPTQITDPITSSDLEGLKKRQQVKDLNAQIAMASFSTSSEQSVVTRNRDSYQIGPGDVLNIAVFQADELNKKVRVSGDSYIVMPLLGGISVRGMTSAQLERHLATLLGEKYLQDPQVSVFIEEFRSQQVAVMGAVSEPNIYNIQQPQTVLELLSMAGGLSEKAGTRVQVRRTVVNPDSGQQEAQTLIMELKALLETGDQRLNVVMGGGDSIVVPEAGTVFVEGAVLKPGAYPMHGETNVLKAITQAGGLKYEAKDRVIQVYRQALSGENEKFTVDLDKAKIDQGEDMALQDGDIVVVDDNKFKKGLAGFWRGLTGVFSIGKSI